MVTKIYHKVHNNIRSNFYTGHEVWIGLDLVEFGSKADGTHEIQIGESPTSGNRKA